MTRRYGRFHRSRLRPSCSGLRRSLAQPSFGTRATRRNSSIRRSRLPGPKPCPATRNLWFRRASARFCCPAAGELPAGATDVTGCCLPSGGGLGAPQRSLRGCTAQIPVSGLPGRCSTENSRVTVAVGPADLRFKSYLFYLSGQPLFVFFTIWEEANLDGK